MAGSEEQKVRNTLALRPAGELEKLSRQASTCFIGLFNGAMRPGFFTKSGGLCIGKAECEWGWPKDWEELRDAGLIEFEVTEVPVHSGVMKELTWKITVEGWKVREDDLAYFRELMDAMKFDFGPSGPSPLRESEEQCLPNQPTKGHSNGR